MQEPFPEATRHMNAGTPRVLPPLPFLVTAMLSSVLTMGLSSHPSTLLPPRGQAWNAIWSLIRMGSGALEKEAWACCAWERTAM